jgi:hypothetical protein
MARWDDSASLVLDRSLVRLGELWNARKDATQLAHLAVAAVFLLVVLTAAAWMIGLRVVSPAEVQGVAAAEAQPAPVVSGLVPKQRIRPRPDVQPVALQGRHFLPDMTVTITMPDARMATYGAEALTNVSSTRLTLRAIFDIPGTYHLTFRTPTGTHSNEVTVAVAR